MTEARVTQAFKGVRDGESAPVSLQPGDTVTGDLARVAIENGWAEAADSPPPADEAPGAAPKRRRRRKAG